jgi:hypothetical protein
MPPAAKTQEIVDVGPEQTLMGQGKGPGQGPEADAHPGRGPSQQNTITLKRDSQVLFGRLTPAKAAKEWISQMKASMAAAG